METFLKTVHNRLRREGRASQQIPLRELCSLHQVQCKLTSFLDPKQGPICSGYNKMLLRKWLHNNHQQLQADIERQECFQ